MGLAVSVLMGVCDAISSKYEARNPLLFKSGTTMQECFMQTIVKTYIDLSNGLYFVPPLFHFFLSKINMW